MLRQRDHDPGVMGSIPQAVWHKFQLTWTPSLDLNIQACTSLCQVTHSLSLYAVRNEETACVFLVNSTRTVKNSYLDVSVTVSLPLSTI